MQSENLSLSSTSGHYADTQSKATGSFNKFSKVLNPEGALSSYSSQQVNEKYVSL
jgi:hypothetical protein